MFIPDPGSEFFHHGSRIKDKKETGSRIRVHNKKRVLKFLKPKYLLLLSWIPDFFHSGSLIPDPGSGSATLGRTQVCKVKREGIGPAAKQSQKCPGDLSTARGGGRG
jgi:hypothetical protein